MSSIWCLLKCPVVEAPVVRLVGDLVILRLILFFIDFGRNVASHILKNRPFLALLSKPIGKITFEPL